MELFGCVELPWLVHRVPHGVASAAVASATAGVHVDGRDAGVLLNTQNR